MAVVALCPGTGVWRMGQCTIQPHPLHSGNYRRRLEVTMGGPGAPHNERLSFGRRAALRCAYWRCRQRFLAYDGRGRIHLAGRASRAIYPVEIVVYSGWKKPSIETLTA